VVREPEESSRVVGFSATLVAIAAVVGVIGYAFSRPTEARARLKS
jgi:hypothetical protein